MSSSSQPCELHSAIPPIRPDQVNWYALQTRARHEKSVAERLQQEQNVVTFLPLVRQVHRWSDRRKVVELPLFSCYVFVRLVLGSAQSLRVCRTDGVFRIVGIRGQGIPIPDEQIEAVRTLVGQQLPWSIHPFLKIGQRVRIRGGSLDGVEGILLSRNGDRTLVVSVDAIQRSLAVHIVGYDVEPI
jgi:transcription antitermination factor NusG